MSDTDIITMCRDLADKMRNERRRGAHRVVAAARELASELELYQQEIERERAELSR